MKSSRDNYIICPNCGREYLAAEVFMPKSFLGNPYDIEKNDFGKIEVYNGNDMCLTESYICDGCGKEFVSTAKITFKTVLSKRELAKSPYKTDLFMNRLSLKESD